MPDSDKLTLQDIGFETMEEFQEYVSNPMNSITNDILIVRFIKQHLDEEEEQNDKHRRTDQRS